MASVGLGRSSAWSPRRCLPCCWCPGGVGLLADRNRLSRHGTTGHVPRDPSLLGGYALACWAAAGLSAAGWCRRRLTGPPEILRFHRTRSKILHAASLPDGDCPHHFLVHLPGNESLRLDLTERAIELPRLPPALDGLSIVHVSDFHFTGRVGKVFFQEIVRVSNDLEPDLVAVTGDLVDRSACLPWIPETLGRLKARYGVHVVLGNHDLRVDKGRCWTCSGGPDWSTWAADGSRSRFAANGLCWRATSCRGFGRRPT